MLSWPESIRAVQEVRFEYRFDDARDGTLNEPVLDRGDGDLKLHLPQRTLGFGA